MVSPWMEHGNLQQYIAANSDVQPYSMVRLTWQLGYLSTDSGVVHADGYGGGLPP